MLESFYSEDIQQNIPSVHQDTVHFKHKLFARIEGTTLFHLAINKPSKCLASNNPHSIFLLTIH